MSLLPPEKECLRLQIESAAGHGCVEEYGLSVRATMPGHSHHDPEASLEPTPDNERVIDREGFRPNVGIVVCNDRDQVLWGRRINGRDSWQFPQGGMHRDESPEQAMYRELEEEVGLRAEAVELLGRTQGWLHYRLPKRFIRHSENPVCVGQKQIWFLLRLISEDSAVRLDATTTPSSIIGGGSVIGTPSVRSLISSRRYTVRRCLNYRPSGAETRSAAAGGEGGNA